MKRLTIVTLLVAAMLVSVAPAYASQVISLGVTSIGGKSYTYGYGEFDLSRSLHLGLEYRSNQVFAVSLWQGATQGFYGEIETGGDDQLIQVGVWRSMPLADNIELSGWIGVQSELGGASGVWAKANAEAAISLTDQIALFVGGGATLLKEEPVTSTYAGVGYYF